MKKKQMIIGGNKLYNVQNPKKKEPPKCFRVKLDPWKEKVSIKKR